MTESKYVLSLTIIFLLCLGLFTSCSENNPVIHINDPVIGDSNYFNWKFDTLQVMVASGMYIADTNDIYIPTYHNYMININNGTLKYKSYNDNDFAGWCIAGTSNNNVYIGGSSIEFYRSKLKMWNGSVIKDIIMPIDTSTNIFSIEAVSSNDIWIATNKPIVYHYLNQSFATYRFDSVDSKLSTGIIFKDKSGDLYVHFLKLTTGSYDYVYIFKFNNNSWTQVSMDSLSPNSRLQSFSGFSDNKILYYGSSGLYYFTGSSWEIYINMPTSIQYIYKCCGRDAQSVFIQARENDQTYFYYYDGKQFYRNSELVLLISGLESMQYKFGRYYITTGEDWMGNSLFGTGSFK
jgi:hypothetical protein